MSEKRKKTIADLLLIAVCSLLALSLGIGIFVLPRQSFSQEENRALASLPALRLSSLASGSYFSGVSAFYSDNIPLRNRMISLKAMCELALGKGQNNNVIFCDGGRLIDRCEYSDTSMLGSNLASLKAFAGAVGAVCALIPRSVDVCSPYVSEQARRTTDAVYSSGVCDGAILDTLISLSRGGTDVYYKTDHHLSAEGAYAVYSYLSGSLGYTAHLKNEFEAVSVSDDFLGSTYSRSGLIATARDSVVLYRYEGDGAYTVSCSDAGCSQRSLYDMSKLALKDKYTVFLGGNHGLIEISSPTEQRPCLLLIKDSFANAVIPLLARHFDITAIDPRYYNGSLSALMRKSDFDRVLVLCGIDTLATNGSFKKL